ncbi:hypothetical protein [Neptunomonas phycophila]|uniref:hypothetical protein n=1 Tax=Neptunomonas phycophila TaxID=1572645 RepID=UPI000948D594|nr:hypothetical protein [Neptunomonas phycophila]
MTGIYKPTLEDIAYLANEHPEKFKNANETLRSIENVMNHDPVVRASTEDATIINQYEDYLKRGGEHLSDSPIPKEASVESDVPAMDAGFSNTACGCKSNAPCCVTKLTIGCEHKKIRLILPEPKKEDAEGKKLIKDSCSITLVGDKDLDGKKGDKLIVALENNVEPLCNKNSGPELLLTGHGLDVRGKKIKQNVFYKDEYDFAGLTAAKKFMFLIYDTFANNKIENIAQQYRVDVLSCGQRSNSFGVDVNLYPNINWSGDIEMENSITIFFGTNVLPVWVGKAAGKLKGVYGQHEFSLGQELMELKGEAAAPMFPFFGKVKDLIVNKFGSGNVESEGTSIGSSLKIYQKFSLKDTGMTVAESNQTKSGMAIDATLKVALDPLLGIEGKIDIVQLVLNAIKLSGAGAPVAVAIEEARERAAKGWGNENSKAKGKIYAGINLILKSGIKGEFSASVELRDELDWTNKASGGGYVSVTLEVVVKGEAEVYFIKGSFEASGNAQTSIELNLSRETGVDYLAKCELEWGGLKLEYTGKAAGGFSKTTIEKTTKGEIPIFQKETLGSFTI